MKNCRNVRFVCSFVQKMEGNHLLSMFSAALPHCFQRRSPSLQIRLCSLSHFCPPENVLFPVVFALAPVRLGRVSSFFLLSLLLSSTPSQALQILGFSSFNQTFFVISLSGLEMFKSASLWEIFFGSYVKVLSVASWNYLGAKLIALDPTSHCNRLSANLGFSHCSQVSPRQWLHQAVCSSQGFDLCHTLPGSPLSHTNFVLSVAVMFVRTLFSFVSLSSVCPFSHTEHLNCV